MSLERFIDEWEASKKDSELSQIKDYWEVRADEFNDHDKSNYDDIIPLFEERGIVKSNYDILDIGCGPGKLSINIAKKVRSITGIDISEKMVKHAEENAEYVNLKNTSFKVASWQEINLREESFHKKFDVVIASMTPGINSYDTLSKMLDASKNHCFLSSYVYRKDLRNEIEDHLAEKSKESQKNKIYYVFNILWELGYFPELLYKDVDVTNVYTYEKAVEIYITEFLAEGYKKKKIEEFLLSKTNDEGMVVQKYSAKVAWMLWNCKK
ncbi:class I SAM-dependent methyltransferase [Alkalibaculum sporogenes]|uniref:class I SAM-dependent methyltransferase n=1 Tax=Alkalibaculum sporogenes TaxID=2655001 RepID=UPI00128D8870|nr:class I SAM-dependent methyltransferase [Alkalibaculum sporogenes]